MVSNSFICCMRGCCVVSGADSNSVNATIITILSFICFVLQIQHFLQFVKTIYKDLPTNVV